MHRLYPLLNFMLHVLHACIISFTLLGWLWGPWRLYHLAWIVLTLGSWYGLGLWMGMGYCPVTEFHWTVKEKLGEGRPECNYIYYWLAKLPAMTFDPGRVEKATVISTLLAGTVSLILNIRDHLL
ncbi:MAG TPA: DUF2784 family protein [Syntrophales bacterium]|mgnify:CR=1 FL=1|jgi:hypothetical protein|nr:DUF2784 family protein [Syntrophales bacterium]HQA82284.1 DUF2784 family protein [Syntrophales bacterium]